MDVQVEEIEPMYWKIRGEFAMIVYENTKTHRFLVSLDYGEAYVEVTRKELQGILKLVDALKSEEISTLKEGSE
jgi:hypothetical protein